jgi:CheY-like chemotaxis protein/HPt (histidine-containing phosphotransfer) domain-containing protein
MRVLLVDDNPTVLSGLSQILQSLTFRVVLAHSGLEALALLEQADSAGDPFLLVILDYQMPQLDGLETARRINECTPPLSVVPRVILLSRDDWDERLNRPEEFGVSGYLLKPVTSSELFDAIMVAFSAPIRGGSELCRKSRKAYSFWGTAANLTGIKALLVEDNEINQLVATELLSSWGVEVVVARNGVEAVALAQNGDFNVILMDIQMPKMDGFTATREIRRLPAKSGKVPIIAMTAHAMAGDREKSLAAGMNDHITKPIDPKLLHAALRRWCEAVPGSRSAMEPRLAEEIREDDFPAELTGIDWADGIKRVAGNRRLYRQLLQMFSRDFAPFTAQVQAALAGDDLETAQRLTHTLKGLAGQLGMPAVQDAASDLEAGIRDKGGEVADLLQRTAAELAPILATLSGIFSTKQTPAAPLPPDLDLSELDRLLKEFSRLLEVNDMQAISLFEELQAHLRQLRPAESLRLAAHLEVLNFKGARQVISEIGEALGISPLPREKSENI